MVRSRSTFRVVALLVLSSTALLAYPAVEPRAGVSQLAAPRLQQTPLQSSAWILVEAERLSGRAVTLVCATTSLEWGQSLVSAGLTAGAAEEYYGFSHIDRGEIHLSPYVCEGLRLGAKAATRKRNDLQVAWSVNVLIHESVHLARSSSDEAQTEACARQGLPAELHRLYGVAFGSAELARLTLAATWFRRTQGSAYQGGTCAPAGGAMGES